MRSSSFARVVIASLGVITLGCDKSGPSQAFSVLSMSPTEGTAAGGTQVWIRGTGFIIRGKAGATVTVDGSIVASSPLPDGNIIRLTMPAHAAGKVDVTVIEPLGQAQASVPGGFTYAPLPPPVITELRPNTGATVGGTPVIIIGREFRAPVSVTVGGIAVPFEPDEFGVDVLYLTTPAHAAGTVEVIVTERDGRTASALFTYASPAAFDFNGNWQGWAQDAAGVVLAPLALTIRDNIVVSASCGAASLTLDPPPAVANGEFSFAGSGVSITGTIDSAAHATGTIGTAFCPSRQWWAVKR